MVQASRVVAVGWVVGGEPAEYLDWEGVEIRWADQWRGEEGASGSGIWGVIS